MEKTEKRNESLKTWFSKRDPENGIRMVRRYRELERTGKLKEVEAEIEKENEASNWALRPS